MRELEGRDQLEEAQRVGVSSLACTYGIKSPNPRLSLAIQLLILSKYIVIIVLWSTTLLYSLPVEGRVIICSVSMVLGLGYS
jgi:hypothetical protein